MYLSAIQLHCTMPNKKKNSPTTPDPRLWAGPLQHLQQETKTPPYLRGHRPPPLQTPPTFAPPRRPLTQLDL
jgi:hypothetical protein